MTKRLIASATLPEQQRHSPAMQAAIDTIAQLPPELNETPSLKPVAQVAILAILVLLALLSAAGVSFTFHTWERDNRIIRHLQEGAG